MELHLERVLKVEAGCWLNQEDAQRTIGQRGRQELPLAHQALPQSIKVLTAFAGVAGRFDREVSHRSGRSGDALCGDRFESDGPRTSAVRREPDAASDRHKGCNRCIVAIGRRHLSSQKTR